MRWIDEANVVPVQEELLTTFERKRQFAAFKEAAVRGKEVIDARLGSTDLALCLGLTACVSEAPESTPSDNKPAANKTDTPAANKTDTPVAAKVAMTSTALTLSKVP